MICSKVIINDRIRNGIQTFSFICILNWASLVGGSDGKEFACNTGYMGSIPGCGRSPGEGNGNLLQSSWLENPTDRGAWRATVHESILDSCAFP